MNLKKKNVPKACLDLKLQAFQNRSGKKDPV